MSDRLQVKMNAQAERELLHDHGVAQELRGKAQEVQRRAKVRAGLTTSIRAGIGPHGAFAQVIMVGDGALAEEFGSRGQPPRAPLRTALRSIR